MSKSPNTAKISDALFLSTNLKKILFAVPRDVLISVVSVPSFLKKHDKSTYTLVVVGLI
jgi:uncharacterized membrane protein